MQLDCTNLIKPTPNVIHRVFPFVTIPREFEDITNFSNNDNHVSHTYAADFRKFTVLFNFFSMVKLCHKSITILLVLDKK